MFLEYLKSLSKLQPERNKPNKSDASLWSTKRFDECRRLRRFTPSFGTTTNTSTTAAESTEPAAQYKPGITARIDKDGTVNIDDRLVYENVDDLKPARGYKMRAENGNLIVNDKIVITNIPISSKYGKRGRLLNFQSGSDELTIRVLENGRVRCTDGSRNTTFF